MGIKSTLVRPIANIIAKNIEKHSLMALEDQKAIRSELIKKGRLTQFGNDHNFKSIKSYQDFSKQVPINDYEGLSKYIEEIKKGKPNILWPGKPKYLAKTSGTTSGIKYIPLTTESMPNHFNSARNALFNYFARTGKGQFFDGKMIFLSGSPELDKSTPIPTGRLSGIVNHEIPGWLTKNQVPTYETNCIEDWEAKVAAIVNETVSVDMRLISGIPPWVQMYVEKLLEKSGKKHLNELYPNFSMYVYGGVNYAPYRQTLNNLYGFEVDTVETFPASEGFIAFQDEQGDDSLLLLTNSGIYYEFIEADSYGTENQVRVDIEGVRTGIPYALIINSNAGLWGYSIGDLVEFTSINPYKIKFAGRISHYISAFGEHVIGKEVEDALNDVLALQPAKIAEFTVAPFVNPGNGQLPYHEWLIEFEEKPADLQKFETQLDLAMVSKNIYYKDLIDGSILNPLKVTSLKKGSFISYMKSKGKLGGQNKVPRLTNDRKIADELISIQK